MFKKLVSILLVCALIFALSAQMFSASAETVDRLFIVENDLSDDGQFDSGDLVFFKKFLLGVISEVFGSADINGDTAVDVRDLIRLKKLLSADVVWDLSNVENNAVIATNGSWAQPLWFKQTGNAALIQTEVTRLDTKANTDGTRHTQPLVGLKISDGTNSGYIGIRANAFVTNGDDSNWERVIGRDMFVTWMGSENQTAQLDFVLQDNKLQIYIDGKGMIEKALSDIVPGIADNATVSVGLVTDTFGEIAKLQFADIDFTTDAAKVAEYNSLGCGLVKYAFVNGKVLTSAVSDWDISDVANGNVRAASALGYSDQPIYFPATGNYMRLSTHVKVTDDTAGRPIAGLYMSDGTKGTWVGVRGDLYHSHATNGGLYAPANLGSEWLSPENGGPKEADIVFELKGDILTVTVNGTKSASVSLSDIGLPTKKDLAFALFARRGTKSSVPVNLDMTYSNIDFKVNDYELPNDNNIGDLFVKNEYIYGKRVTSANDKWDLTDVENDTVRTTNALGGKQQPLYFAESGNTMHLSTHVSVSDDSHSTVGAGLWMSDGYNRMYICFYGNKMIFSPYGQTYATYFEGTLWSETVLTAGAEVDLDFVFVNDVLTITVNGTESIDVPASDLQIPTGSDWQFALVARTDGTNTFDVTFSDVEFTTDADAVAAFLAGK